MKHHILVALLLASTPLRSEEPPAKNPVMLAKAGDIDQALVDRLKQWVESELAIPLPIAESLSAENYSLESVAEAAASRLGPDDAGIVILDTLADTSEPNGIYHPEKRVVVINVADMREGADEEVFARRLERQVVRGVCVLLGLEWSPNPESAMAVYSNLAELDQIGRNLDPPWLLKLQRRAHELGIPLDAENQNNLINE